MACPRTSNQTLQQRLFQLIGKNVEIQAENVSLEAGRLQAVCGKSFIRVTGELFVPQSLNQLRVFGVPRRKGGKKVNVRITYGSNLMAFPLVQIGRDFVELQSKGTSQERILIPLNKVIGLF